MCVYIYIYTHRYISRWSEREGDIHYIPPDMMGDMVTDEMLGVPYFQIHPFSMTGVPHVGNWASGFWPSLDCFEWLWNGISVIFRFISHVFFTSLCSFGRCIWRKLHVENTSRELNVQGQTTSWKLDMWQLQSFHQQLGGAMLQIILDSI